MSFDYKIPAQVPTQIHFGSAALDLLKTLELPGKKALIVISNGHSVRRHGVLSRVQTLLRENGTESLVFDKIQPNPILEHVMEGAEIAKANGCDLIIGLGGGSPIDSAKSIAVMAKNSGNYWDYINGGSGKNQPTLGGALPIIAIPTTAGTGTESDPWTVITKSDTNEKVGFGNQYTFPTISIIDPDLMLTVPRILTVYQGFDTLFHATEGYIANIATAESDSYALRVIELVNTYLPIAMAQPDNVEARSQMALASTLAGFVETLSSCTSEHSMEHALSAYHPELTHGAGLIMLSQAYYRFFDDKVAGKMAAMAQAMGITAPLCEQPMAFADALDNLQQICGVDNLKMSDFGISEQELDTVAHNAKQTMGGLFDLDRHNLTHAETLGILQASYK